MRQSAATDRWWRKRHLDKPIWRVSAIICKNKTDHMQVRRRMQVLAAGAGLLLFSACSKSGSDTVKTSTPPLQVGQAVSSTSPLSGSVKGTMLSGQTYTLGGGGVVNAGGALRLPLGGAG